MTVTLILIFLCAFVAFSISAVCGGGAGLLLIPLLGQALPVAQVPTALSIGTASSSITRIGAFYSQIRWSIVRWFVPGALPAVFLGASLLHFLNPIYLEIAMGLFLVGNLPLLFKNTPAGQHKHSSHRVLLVIGFLAGFLSGLTGAVGLLFNRFYLRYGLSKEEIIATRAANELILHVIKLALYISFGLLSKEVILIGMMVALAAALSSWVMRWGIKKVSESIFRKLGYASMVISGIALLSQSGSRLFAQNKGNLTFSPLTSGIESKLQWQNTNLAIEFTYDEGFEYEQKIPFSELPLAQQSEVLIRKGDADNMIIEEVFGFGKHSYEAYYFHEGKLIGKIDL